MDIERVKGTLTKDTEYDVHYTRTEYTLTILYQYADGTTAAETYTATLNTGDAYSVVSPVIEGYYKDQKFRNMSVLLNGTTAAGSRYGYHRYGYRYGYAYGYGNKGYGGYTEE